MAFSILQPSFLNEKGRRKNNEDSIYPAVNTATVKDRLFLVCDGVGGANKGEVASSLACQWIPAFFAEHPPKKVDAEYFALAIKFAEGKMSEHISKNAECVGMACTVTLLYLDDRHNSATIAWIGDSRVYQVRKGEIKYMTSDHSLVNELVKRGELAPEEAVYHPRRNVILRALSGSESPIKGDLVEITDLQAGDYFMLCSDGILESVDNRILQTLLASSEMNAATATDQILQMCLQNSNDNFSMYLLQLGDVASNTATPKKNEKNTPKKTAPKSEPLPLSVTQTPESLSKDANKRTLQIVISVAALALLSIIGYFVLSSKDTKQAKALYIQADSLRNAGNPDKAFELYAQSLSLQHDPIVVQRMEELKKEISERKTQDSLRLVIDDMWMLDSLLYTKANVSKATLSSYAVLSDTAQLNTWKRNMELYRVYYEKDSTFTYEKFVKAEADSAAQKAANAGQ